MIDANRFNKVGDKVFLNSTSPMFYDNIVQKSIASNTYRSFWRIDKSKPGAKKIVDSYLMSKHKELINSLKSVLTEIKLEELSHSYCEEIRDLLRGRIKSESKVNSYNKTRKLVDLFMEHLVALSSDLKEQRCNLVPLLFVPLDSQILKCEDLIDKTTRTRLGINNSSSFASIETKEDYKELQSALKKKAVDLGIKHRIYLDLIWNNRYLSDANNLLDLN